MQNFFNCQKINLKNPLFLKFTIKFKVMQESLQVFLYPEKEILDVIHTVNTLFFTSIIDPCPETMRFRILQMFL
jgi:hypothetical protein